MKTLLTIIIAIATLTIGSATTTPVTNAPAKLIATAAIEIAAVGVEGHALFESATYNVAEENIAFTTVENVDMIQIFNAEGNLEFQLPVMSNQVSISKALFSQGESQLGFIMSGKAEVFMTTVNIK